MSRFHSIAPSGYCISQRVILRGPARLTETGRQVDNSAIIVRRCRCLAGAEVEGLVGMNSLVNLKTPGIIVMVIRGDYGVSRLLEGIDQQGLAACQQQGPLLLCGHSDLTTIRYGLPAQGNVINFSGPILAVNFGAEEMNAFTKYHFWQALCNAQFTLEWQGDGPQCATEGTLWDGNLAIITSLMGMPWMPAVRNGTLALEDINEHPLRVGRMPLQLYHVGIPAQQSAITLGSFSDSMPDDYDAGYNLDPVCDFLRARLSVPLIYDLDFGHEQRTVTLPLGTNAVLENNKDGAQFTLGGHPVLKS